MYVPRDHVKMAGDKRYHDLEPELRLRIRRVGIISGVWFGLILLGAIAFNLSRPYLDKRREEREKRFGPAFVPKIRPHPQTNTKEDSSKEL